MKFFICLLLQFFIFMPVVGFASNGGINPVTQDKEKVKITDAQKTGVIKTYGKLPLYFIENRGQVAGQVSFYERGAGHATFFTNKGVVLSFTKSEGKEDTASFNKNILGLEKEKSAKATTESVSLSFVGANKKARITANDKKTGHVNYFVGNDKSKWRSNIPTYGAVTYKDVYKNIDVKFYGNNKNIEHDVIVRPGGDISNVKFRYERVQGLEVTKSGDLEVSLTDGKLVEKRPVIYQEIKGQRVTVKGAYRILKGKDGAFTYGFDVASYDRTKDLVIDPVLVYSTYFGGSVNDFAFAIAVDGSSNVYLTGSTSSGDFPLKLPIQGSLAGASDIFITKINPAGTSLIYSTYIGGLREEEGNSIAVDAAGNAYVTGTTLSADFPLTLPFQGILSGSQAAFVTKINPAGSALAYSTYLGGSGGDVGTGITVDGVGNAYVAGFTWSPDFPLVNPIQASYAGGFNDGFVTKINPIGSALVYSTYLGGSGKDGVSGIALDGSGNAYVTGGTNSIDFPMASPIQASNAGFDDIYITKINSTGSGLLYSTYLGGSAGDRGFGIAVDAPGNAYVTGSTMSADFPLATPIQGILSGGTDAVVMKLSSNGAALSFSTYLGGTGIDDGYSIALDASANVYITGDTNSIDFPVVSPVQGINAGGAHDIFISKLNSFGTILSYSTYLGGSGDESLFGIAVESTGEVYVTGWTGSTDFPTVNPIQGASGGALDVFISKISGAPLPALTLTITPDAASIARGSTLGYNVTATNTTTTQKCFQYWEDVTLPGGSTFPQKGALFGPVNLCLNAGASKSAHLTHGVPMSAPVGTYIFNAFVGTNPTPLTSEAHFNFDVTALGPVIQTQQTSWRVLEKGFKQ